LEELRVLDGVEVDRALIAEFKLRKTMVISVLEKATLLEEISWRQESRALWLREGDKCTNLFIYFFHLVANSNRRNNSIETLSANSSVSSDQHAIRDHIVQFYYGLFSEQFSWRPKLDGLAFDDISVEEFSWLKSLLEESEFLGVVKSMNKEKALGPDGLTLAFFSRLLGCDRGRYYGGVS
jgi:hypothetical protein